MNLDVVLGCTLQFIAVKLWMNWLNLHFLGQNKGTKKQEQPQGNGSYSGDINDATQPLISTQSHVLLNALKTRRGRPR